jgi:hypothetical protein
MGADQIPDLRLGDSRHAVDWRRDLSPSDLELRAFDCCLGRLHRSCGCPSRLINVSFFID